MAHLREEAECNGFRQNRFSDHIGSEFLALLECLYALRDALNEYFYLAETGESTGFSTSKLGKLVSREPASAAAKVISSSMFDEKNGDRLIYRMSLIRAVSQHCLGHVNPIVGDYLKPISAKGSLGGITWMSFPLYDDIEMMKKIEAGERDPLQLQAVNAEWVRFSNLSNHTDALKFGVSCFLRLLEIGLAISTGIKIRPKIPVFKSGDSQSKVSFVDLDEL